MAIWGTDQDLIVCNELPADAARPGLLKYIEYGKYGRIFCH